MNYHTLQYPHGLIFRRVSAWGSFGWRWPRSFAQPKECQTNPTCHPLKKGLVKNWFPINHGYMMIYFHGFWESPIMYIYIYVYQDIPIFPCIMGYDNQPIIPIYPNSIGKYNPNQSSMNRSSEHPQKKVSLSKKNITRPMSLQYNHWI